MGVADVLTASNGACGLLAIWMLLTHGRDVTLGSALILLGMVFDGADGWAARRWGTKHDLGRHLDSACDAITFCAAPAVMVYVVFHDVAPLPVAVTAALVTALGWTRLYRFTTTGYRLPDFSGLATPALAFLAVVVSHVLHPDRWDGREVEATAVAMALLSLASLSMVTRVRYPKVRGRVGVAFGLTVVGGLAVVGVMRHYDVEGTYSLYRALSVLALALVAIYMLLGPAYLALRDQRRAV